MLTCLIYCIDIVSLILTWLFHDSNGAVGWACSCRLRPGTRRIWERDSRNRAETGWTLAPWWRAASTAGGPELQDDAFRTALLLSTATCSDPWYIGGPDETRSGWAAGTGLPDRWKTLRYLFLLPSIVYVDRSVKCGAVYGFNSMLWTCLTFKFFVLIKC